MPLFYDLLLKSGVPSERVLDEKHLLVAERILDSVAKFEFHEISWTEHLVTCRCRLFERGFTVECVDEIERELVFRPFEGIPAEYTALNRANTFLYATGLVSSDYALVRQLWESFMPLILFLDDVEDLDADRARGEENALLQGVSVEESFFALHPILKRLLLRIQPLNPAVFAHLENLRQQAFQKGFLRLIKS